MYDDVLVATDGSAVATDAASVAIAIARAVDATVHALSVVETRLDNASRRSRREADAQAVSERAADAGCASVGRVSVGRPAGEIRAAADAVDADLLVVGTRGRSGVERLLLGSVALEVIRDAERPVLSVSPAASWDEERSLDDVLLATDGWSGSTAATEHALALAEAFDARLDALYVVDADAEGLREGFETHAETVTDGVLESARDRGIEATRSIERGPAHERIAAHARETDADLLVMGTEGKSGVERLVIGSVSQRVIPAAPVPVVTIRSVDT